MRKLISRFSVLTAVLLLVLGSCQKQVHDSPNGNSLLLDDGTTPTTAPPPGTPYCGTPLVRSLKDVNGVEIGGATVSNDATTTTVYIESFLTGSSVTKVTLVYGSQQHVTDALTNQTNWTPCDGPALYDLQNTYAPGSGQAIITIPNSAFADNCPWFSVTVQLQDASGQPVCGYADPLSLQFGPTAWIGAFQYCLQTCTEPPSCGPLRTQTQGGWGAVPKGKNPGTYLHANFDAAFPSGLTVGCTPNFNIRLTSAQAITDLLPTGGTPAVLKANATNPSSSKNVLVGQIVALSLSVGFDAYDPNFGKGGVLLGDMTIGSGTFANWTVSAFLAEANKVLGGCSSAYTPAQINETADKINNNFDNGNTDKGYLLCPTIR